MSHPFGNIGDLFHSSGSQVGGGTADSASAAGASVASNSFGGPFKVDSATETAGMFTLKNYDHALGKLGEIPPFLVIMTELVPVILTIG